MSETASIATFTSPKLFILAGIPGCGKSTWANRFFKSYQIVSSDAIREEKWPNEPYKPERNEEVFSVFHDRIAQGLESGVAVCADATFLSSAARIRVINIADRFDAEKHLIFFNNPADAFERNSARDRDPSKQDWVPYEAMEYMLQKFFETKAAIIDEEYTTITSIEGTYEPNAATADDLAVDPAASALSV
jgi:predicted kinase